MHRPLHGCLPALLLALIPLARAGADGRPLPQRWAALRSEARERLHALADWCGKKQLFGARAEVYEGVLRLDPDDGKARKRLKYERDEEGRWVRRRPWKAPRNLGRGLEDLRARRVALGLWFEGAAGALREAAYEEGAWRLGAEIVGAALALDPDREAFRGWNHEARARGRGWILEETRAAAKRRPGIRAAAEQAVAAVPAPKPTAARRQDRHGNVAWQARLRGTRVRVLATTDANEAGQTLRFAEACWPLFRYATGRAAPAFRDASRYAGAGLTIYVFDSLATANAFYGAQPGVTERQRTFTAPLVATWIPRRAAALVKSPDQATRFEAASKQVLGSMGRRVLGLTRTRAWAAEGLALYLNHQLVGTRRIYSVNDVTTKYAEPGRPIPTYVKEMNEERADWLALGRALLTGKDKPDPFLMSGRDFNDLSRAEVLYAYCVAAYVVEGWPDRVVEFFQTVASDHGTDLDRVCLETFGFDMRALERRLVRWLDEAGTER